MITHLQQTLGKDSKKNKLDSKSQDGNNRKEVIKMKIYYNEFKGNNPAAKTYKVADVSYEVGDIHSSKRAYKALKMALEALKETDAQSVTITLVKEPK